MTLADIRREFLDHFETLGYKPKSAASILPDNDPSVLFTTAGMQQFKDYYSSPGLAPHNRLASVQPVVRTTDIEEVGDDTHLTMFEMLGIFSFGQTDERALKEDAIKAMWAFVTDKLKVNRSRAYATVFAGDSQTPEDQVSARVWESLGVQVKKLARADNFWGPTGDEGPCGPNSEIFIDGIEVGNLVFNQYYQDKQGGLKQLDQLGLDFGSGLERLTATLNGCTSVWQIEPYQSWVEFLGEDHATNRRIADHLKAICFIASAGVEPSNKAQGYVLRRLIRSVLFYASNDITRLLELVGRICASYADSGYLLSPDQVIQVIKVEQQAFSKNLTAGSRIFTRWLEQGKFTDARENAKLAFTLYTSYGYPLELSKELFVENNKKLDETVLRESLKQHQDTSRTGAEGQFKGGLADHQEQTIKHHTAHHLLLAALRQVLGNSVVQRGSNVTSERLRLDFAWDQKLTDQQKQEVESIVNDKIKADLTVQRQEMALDEALATGAQAEFGQKYGSQVTVYTIGDFSKELCGGPHVNTTSQLGRLEIIKEEPSSRGVRRIKARLVS